MLSVCTGVCVCVQVHTSSSGTVCQARLVVSCVRQLGESCFKNDFFPALLFSNVKQKSKIWKPQIHSKRIKGPIIPSILPSPHHKMCVFMNEYMTVNERSCGVCPRPSGAAVHSITNWWCCAHFFGFVLGPAASPASRWSAEYSLVAVRAVCRWHQRWLCKSSWQARVSPGWPSMRKTAACSSDCV